MSCTYLRAHGFDEAAHLLRAMMTARNVAHNFNAAHKFFDRPTSVHRRTMALGAFGCSTAETPATTP